MKVRNGSCLLAVTALLLCVGVASASTCLSKPTVAQALKDSKVVFAGRVVATFKYGVKFRVDRAWKGVSGRYVYIYTGNLRNDVDPWFEKGEWWLVYASDVPLYRTENAKIPYTTRLMAPPCKRTILLRHAADDLKQLGEVREQFRTVTVTLTRQLPFTTPQANKPARATQPMH